MFRLKVKVGKRWMLGLNDYTEDQVIEAKERLEAVGVSTKNIKIVTHEAIFN